MTKCARCGNEAQGYATIGLLRYCHGDQEQPTCYMQQNWDNMRDRLNAYDDDLVRTYVNSLWRRDWDSPEDAAYDESEDR